MPQGVFEGFSQGFELGSNIRRNRQLEKLRALEIEDLTRQGDAYRLMRKEVGLPETLTEGLEDPLLFKWIGKLRGRKNKPVAGAAAVPTAGIAPVGPVAAIEPAGIQPSGMETFALEDEEGYADGGRVSDEELERRQNREYRRQVREEADRTPREKPTQSKAPKAQKGRVFRPDVGKLRQVGAAGAAGAAIHGGMLGLGTPTEDYYTRMGLDPNEAGTSFGKDLAVRTGGVMSDVGASTINTLRGLPVVGGVFGEGDYRQNFADVAGQEQAGAPQTPQGPTALDLSEFPVGGGRTSAQISARVPGQRRAAAGVPDQGQGQFIDVSTANINPEDVPNVTVDEWAQMRQRYRQIAGARGTPESVANADNAVTQMQMRGFLNYTSQAQALLQVGNLQGAATALRAAYQYFPNGTDSRFQVHNGHLVAYPYDEKTGKVLSDKARVITPEYLAGAVQNFSNPQNFLSWTKDWRGEQFTRQKYAEVDKPLAQAQAQALATNAEANVARAEAADLRARLSGAQGGLRPSDFARSEAAYRERLELMGIQDPQEADRLASVMSQVKARYPNVPDNTIMFRVLEREGYDTSGSQ
jgi:hypothetical protein